MISQKRSSLLSVLVCLTILSIIAQFILFAIHSQAFELLDAFVGSSISTQILHKAILLPLLQFIGLQLVAYLILISYIWFITVSCSHFFRCSDYVLGVFFWLVVNWTILLLNFHYFPASFFASLLGKLPYERELLFASLFILGFATLLAYYQVLRKKRHVSLGLGLFAFVLVLLLARGLNEDAGVAHYQASGTSTKPNIILIGLDSLRPDYISYFGNKAVHTPAIDQFLKAAVYFTEVYTPLARTFPAWVSILTAKHPKHSQARINLDEAGPVAKHATLAKQLKAANYETMYATDEKRFSNITTDYGFDSVLGPRMGLDDFILGSLSDFPLTNLVINLPLGSFLFPYNYGNRAAAITYEPDHFLQQVKTGLRGRSGKPLFLALHFCVSHWPFTWANDHQASDLTLAERYQSSVERVDKQFQALLQILKENGLLENSLLILLSDHGTTLGLPGDRLLTKTNYRGIPQRLNWVTVNKLSSPKVAGIDPENNYSLDTAYGQGTDVLSLKQYQVLLAFNYFGKSGTQSWLLSPHAVSVRASLLDLAPTILEFLHQPQMQKVDGRSLLPYLFDPLKKEMVSMPQYLETGYSVSEIETNKIAVEKVVSRTIQLYEVNPQSGYLSVKQSVKPAVLENKQRAVLWGPWLLARYPATQRLRIFVQSGKMQSTTYWQPPYYVLANLKTAQWTVGLDTAFAQKAPVLELVRYFKAFYGDELD